MSLVVGWLAEATVCHPRSGIRNAREHNVTHTSYWLGVDTGGTFTDFVVWSADGLAVHKVLSTPDDPSRAILQGLDELGLLCQARSGEVMIVHGSTVATNAALERKGVPVAFVTNQGLEDMLTLARQNRHELYNLMPEREAPPVAPEHCFGVPARTGADGESVRGLAEEDVAALVQAVRDSGVEAVAINLVFSWLDDQDERRLEQALSPWLFTSRSSAVLPESGEYERGIATWLNAWLGPLVQRYLQRLDESLGEAPLSMMQSSGGTVALEQAGRRAVNLLLSGPAGGLSAARYLNRALDEAAALTFDMGGTSTDVAMVGQDVRLTSEGRIGPWPVAVPMVDMHTIGAGGGSLIRVDQGGLLQVGPESAGADPGPACYGNGGREPTVTDANLILGRLPGRVLGGAMTLDEAAARAAMAPIAEALNLSVEAAAEGAITVANERMARALRTISVSRGEDPAGYRLCCFGGAGGLHVCALAESMGMQRALVPALGGVLSAFGMLVAPRERQLSLSWPHPVDEITPAQAEAQFRTLEQQGEQELSAEGVSPDDLHREPSVDLRYTGQSFTLNLPWQGGEALGERFARAHEARYGHQLHRPVELVNLRLGLRGPSAVTHLPSAPPESGASAQETRAVYGVETPVVVYWRASLAAGQRLVGPCIIAEQVSTTWLGPGWHACVHADGHLLLERDG